MNSHITHNSSHQPALRPPGITVTEAITQLDDGHSMLDVLRFAYITANRECRALLPQLSAILGWPLHLGTKLLFPPTKNADDHYWSSSELREIALGHVKYSGYHLGKTGDDAEQIFEVPLSTRRQADEALAAAVDHERKCYDYMVPARTCADKLIAQRLKVIALLDRVLDFEDETLPLEQQILDDEQIRKAASSVRQHFKMRHFFQI